MGRWFDPWTGRVFSIVSGSTSGLTPLPDPAIGGSPVWHKAVKQRPPRRAKRRARKKRRR